MTGMEITEVLGNLGDFLGAIAVFATIAYLALQVKQAKQSVDANTDALDNQQRTSRSQSRQALIDTWSLAAWELARDVPLQESLGRVLDDWKSATDADKTAFELAMSRFLMNIQNGLLLRDEGLLDEDTLALVAHYMVYTAASPRGGSLWWAESQIVTPAVRSYVDQRIEEVGEDLVTIDEAMPHWMRAVRMETIDD